MLFILIMWLSTVPKVLTGQQAALAPFFERFRQNGHFSAVKQTVLMRCSMCHASEPAWEGIARPPKQVIFESDSDIASQAREIYLHAGASHAMPPGNLSEITPGERALLVAWYQQSVGGTGQ